MDENEYWDMVEHAKEELINYYGAAIDLFPIAEMELMRIDSMTPDEILDEAEQQGLI